MKRVRRHHNIRQGGQDLQRGSFENTQPRSKKKIAKLDDRIRLIKFKHCDFRDLRARLLCDLSREYYAVLLGKAEIIDGLEVINIYELRFPVYSDYADQSAAFLRIKREFVYKILVELTSRQDVDSIIDVHTHPFAATSVSFSATDDSDENTFSKFLTDKFDGVNYASIVLSRAEYSARIWHMDENRPVPVPALIKTQTVQESIASSDFPQDRNIADIFIKGESSIFDRGTLALGLPAMRQIASGQVISIVGVGGLGSIIAEHLTHMGFHHINLIDNDLLEVTNLNRIVGAYYQDAESGSPKVDAVKRHLVNINPDIKVTAYRNDIHERHLEGVVALSDWIIAATDNHSSRFRVQQLSIKYFVPMISVGVNITVDGGKLVDMSGEVVTARVGDNLCLNCLRRISPIKIASEAHPDSQIRETLVKKGYVAGAQVKEPAVKTLNSILATLAVDTLINQYTERQKHAPVLVYEDNKGKAIYEDSESVLGRNKNCFTCNI